MIFYLAQHGRAVDEMTDPRRPLSEQGIRDTETVADEAAQKGLKIGRIVHSGKLRAEQTARIFAGFFDALEVDARTWMDPNDPVAAFAETMEHDDVLYVGHLPFMKKLVSLLVTGNEKHPVVDVVNSGLVCVERVDGTFVIKWIITPEV